MPEYKLYHFERGQIVMGRVITAEDDVDAIEQARVLASDQPAELWYGTRKVQIFNPIPGRPGGD